MYEKPRRFEESRLEADADAALAVGDTVAADAYLGSLINKDPHPDMLHHAVLKRMALPLYELAYDPSETRDVRVYDDANDVLGLVGHVLQRELQDYSPRYHREVGRLTELTFFALHLRTLFSEQTASVLLPSSGALDRKGIDFHLSPVGTECVNDGVSYQVKTNATSEDQKKYASSDVILISMSDIDPYAQTPDHPESLARTLLRELHIPYPGEGREAEYYSDRDNERLNKAMRWINTKTDLKQERPKRRSRQALSDVSLRYTVQGRRRAA